MSAQIGSGSGRRSLSRELPEDPRPAQVVQKRDFVDRVVAATGAKKSEVCPIIEATLDQLGAALAAGETLAVPPFGRARINRSRDMRGSEVITLRLRRKISDGS